MGMRVSTEEFCQPSDPADYRTVHVANFQRGRVAGFQWRSSKELQKYERMRYLPTEREYRGEDSWRLDGPFNRTPQTYLFGAKPWIDKQAPHHGFNDAYINHIQQIEDIERAHGSADRWRSPVDSTTIEEFLKEREWIPVRTLGCW